VVAVPPGLIVRSNPELLSVVIHNLIDNASKYGRNGQIRIRTNTSGNMVHLIIADSGKGIDPEIREWFNNPPHCIQIPMAMHLQKVLVS